VPPSNNQEKHESLIRMENLSKRFHEGEQERIVLANLTAHIDSGEFVAMVGRSGSGKSTLLNLLAGLDLPSSGDIWIGDAHISAMKDRDRTLFRRDHVGFVFQFFNLIPTLTVGENVLLTAELGGMHEKQAHARADELLNAVGLLDRARVFPDKLSGGEQQRIAIARALCADPDIVLADEPTGNLDADTGQMILELLIRLVRERTKTLIMVTHSPDVAALADRILRLDHGHLLQAARDETAAYPAPLPSLRGTV
jgi:putative ABC transport system ATP-binding protein